MRTRHHNPTRIATTAKRGGHGVRVWFASAVRMTFMTLPSLVCLPISAGNRTTQ
jgi:hypothetical protein